MALASRGGLAHYASQLANALSKRHEVIAVVPEDVQQGLYAASVILQQISPRIVRHVPTARGYMRLYETIASIKPEIVHDPIGPANYWTVGLFPFLQRRWPLVLTLHDPKPHSGVKPWFKEFYRFLVGVAVRSADLIFVHGKASESTVLQMGVPPQKVRIVPHGSYTFFNRGRKEIKEEKHTVLFFGAMRLNKGVDRLPDIAKRVRDVIPDVRFIVAGSSKGGISSVLDRKRIDTIMESLHACDNFEIHDRFIPDSEIEIFFRRASVVLLPYWDATQSGVIMIAFAFGKPVVATRVGDIPDIVEHGKTGFLANPNCDQEIADLVITLLSNPILKRNMGIEAERRARGVLSWDAVAWEVSKQYEELRKKRREK